MYNRYIPDANGVYQRRVVSSPPSSPKAPPVQEAVPPTTVAPHKAPVKCQLPKIHLDSGDLLVLLILLLVITEGEDADPMSALITLAAFLLLQ